MLAEPFRRRVGIALAIMAWAATLVATLYPFRFELDVGSLSRIDWRLYYPNHSDRDLIQNLLLLVPLGVAWALIRFGRGSAIRIALEAGAIGVGTALVVETLQIFERARFPQLADVWRNGVGCVAGAVAVCLVLRARR